MRFTAPIMKIFVFAYGFSSLAQTHTLAVSDYVPIRKHVAQFEWLLESLAKYGSPRSALAFHALNDSTDQIHQTRRTTVDPSLDLPVLNIHAQVLSPSAQKQTGIRTYSNQQEYDLADFASAVPDDISGWIEQRVRVELVNGRTFSCHRFYVFTQAEIDGLIRWQAQVDCDLDGKKFHETLNSYLSHDTTILGDLKAADFVVIRVQAGPKVLWKEALHSGFSPLDLYFSWPTNQ
jgi:hypothetical protein